MNMDRISELPDDLIVQILSSLRTKNAIATSVLSKRWKSLWKMLPKLEFVKRCVEQKYPHIFAENVYKSLMLHKAPVLESLELIFDDGTEKVDVEIWISTAFARGVRKLVLHSYYQDLKKQIVVLPHVLFSYNDTLEILELHCAINLCFPSKVCLKSLRKLLLFHIHFQDEESVCNFLCGCPSLEDLVVHRCNRCSNLDVATFTISVPSLKRLTIEDLNEVGGGIYVINVPALKYLNIKVFNRLDSCLMETVPELVEARISNVYITNENILESLTSAKRLILHLSPLDVKVPTGKIFKQLVSLELCTGQREWWNLLSIMLDSSPKLQILKLTFIYISSDFQDSCGWNQPKCVPECLLFHLETLVWRGYNWQREVEIKVATYVLKHAQCLKTATFSNRGYWDNLESGEVRRRETLDELSSVPRASDSCNLIFET